MRQIRYRHIADALRGRIGAELAPGRILPSESKLGEEFSASRVTIRKALELLREEGLVESRQGLGWIVASSPVPQGLAGLTTIEAELRRSGRRPERRIIDFGFRPTVGDGRREQASKLGDRVLEVVRVNLADGEPFARVTVWCRDAIGAEVSRRQVEQSSFQELLAGSIGGATQTIGAAIVRPEDAVLLEVPPGSAVLVVERTTIDIDGAPLLMSEHVFPAHLTRFRVDLSARDLV